MDPSVSPQSCHPSRPPHLQIPASSSTVDVRVIDTNTRLFLKPGLFYEPALPRVEGPNAPVYCFLVSHGDRHVVFDLGVRTDWEAYAPRVVQLVKATTRVTSCERDVAAVLDDYYHASSSSSSNGGEDHHRAAHLLLPSSAEVEAVVWSHSHFDHAGDPSRFPAHTQLVVGPGVRAASWPGYPTNPDALVLDSDAAGRVVREIKFREEEDGATAGDGGDGPPPLQVAGFDAFDYFGDGSFYLLDAPGHAAGHMCALARTTADPLSFVFMGADACHHPGVLRPSQHLPLPRPAEGDGSSETQEGEHQHLESHGGCFGDLLARIAAWKKTSDEPFYHLPRGPMFLDHEAAVETVAKIQELDAAGNVLVLLAHDDSLHGHLPLFPERVNHWQSLGLREDTRWLFCKELEDFKP
ncbi:hypothetical protein Daus18300_006596 [Diaporthe australafricana]|uniref:Metallo-beta-lactamase domain-containing protein n=1 Tax=Diaporthe australafricana TaxID=127596 RepID=A0ABR3WTL5_9PEZI